MLLLDVECFGIHHYIPEVLIQDILRWLSKASSSKAVNDGCCIYAILLCIYIYQLYWCRTIAAWIKREVGSA